jgi:hypothetical protein
VAVLIDTDDQINQSAAFLTLLTNGRPILVRMSTRTRTTAIALTAAVAVSSVAYGLGSQRGDGSAVAGGSGSSSMSASDRGPGPFGPGLSELADRLGVSTDKLEAALEDIRGIGRRTTTRSSPRTSPPSSASRPTACRPRSRSCAARTATGTRS